MNHCRLTRENKEVVIVPLASELVVEVAQLPSVACSDMALEVQEIVSPSTVNFGFA